jgi:hypothetical protein
MIAFLILSFSDKMYEHTNRQVDYDHGNCQLQDTHVCNFIVEKHLLAEKT